ncbi:MAG: hypothetical protein MJE68_10720 [Proteobacteria bacterium]|nr:hypothetical protein [Pseudomonadota bacterium]
MNGSRIAVGVLAFLIAVLVVLLILAVAALVYFIITILKQKEQLKIRYRDKLLANVSFTNMHNNIIIVEI